MGADTPCVPMDPSQFMLAPFSMTDVEYRLWRDGILYVERLVDDLDYDELSKTPLTPFLSSFTFSIKL